MNSAIVSTERSTRIPVCFVADRHAERALDLEHQLEHVDRVEPEPLAEQRRASPISSGAIGSRRLRTMACLISALSVSTEFSHGHQGSEQSAVDADHLAR